MMVSKIIESKKITQIWIEWMFINVIMCYSSFIICKIIAHSSDYGQYITDNFLLVFHPFSLLCEGCGSLIIALTTYLTLTYLRSDIICKCPTNSDGLRESYVRKNLLHRT